MLLVAACGESVAPPAPAFDHDAATAGLETMFGPVTLSRTRGALDEASHVISTAGFEAPFVLIATSTSGAAWVELDGATVAGPGDFGSGGTVEVEVAVTDGSTLDLRLAGRPGASLTVRIEGQPAGTLFCPGSPVGFDDLQAALDATPTDGTVLICDGEHALDSAIIRRPVTVTALNPGAATLLTTSMSTQRGGLVIDSLASGTVRVHDLRFVGDGPPISAFNQWDQVVVERNVFDLGPSGGVSAVNMQNGVTGAVVVVRDNEFIGGGTSVFLVNASINPAPHGIIEGNTMRGQGFSNLQIQGQATAFVADNVMSECGPVACIQAPTRGSLTVVRNTISTDAAHISRAGIRHQGGGASIVMTDNTITGVVPANPAVPADYGFYEAGILLTITPGSKDIVVERNEVVNAWRGLFYQAPDASVSLAGRDNIFAGTGTGLSMSATGAVSLHRNDVSGALADLQAFGLADGSLTCNWWGSAAGPMVVVGAGAGVYTPFATAPIAGTGLACP